jgi:hypothetical protein
MISDYPGLSIRGGKNCENRNDPDLVQAFLKKWWVEFDFKAPNLPLSLRLKGSNLTMKTTTENYNIFSRSITSTDTWMPYRRPPDS